MSDTAAFIYWYGAMILMSIIGLPLAQYLFHDWRDKGYIFARYIGLFLVAMPLWLLSSLHIVQFNQLSVIIFVVAGVSVAGYLIGKRKIKLTRGMIAQELMFFIFFAVWCVIRSYNSDIFGTEKMMNLAFMNSINLTEYMPPADPWYTGGTINYYYLGHYMYVFIAKLLGISTGLVYNLALTSIIAQFTVSVYAIIRRLTVKRESFIADNAALLGAVWISFGGNLHYPYKFIESVFSGEVFKYFFPDPTRIIPFAIDEFPAYSIVLGDVHGHYISLPFFVLGLALLIASSRVAFDDARKLKLTAIISVFIISMYGVNSWDIITMLFLFTAMHAVQAYQTGRHWKKLASDFVRLQLALVVPGLLLMLPYIFNFTPAVGGVGLVQFDQRSPIVPWVQMWGFFIIGSLAYASFVVLRKRERSQLGLLAAVVVVILAMFAVESANAEALKGNAMWLIGWSIVRITAMAGFAVLLWNRFADKKTLFVAPLFAVAAFCLIEGVEIFFFKDIFYTSNPDYFRTNTVFKFYYHAWVLWGIAVSWFFFRILTAVKGRPRLLSAVALTGFILFCMSTSYIFKAVNDFYPVNANIPIERTLDGTAWITTDHPADDALIDWMNANIEGQPVILEAVGEAYTYAARISTHTGFRTVMGWPTHEWQWRGEARLAFDRADDVRVMYTTQSATELHQLLDQYGVEYIVIGQEEYTKYQDINLPLLQSQFEPLYSQSGTMLLKVR